MPVYPQVPPTNEWAGSDKKKVHKCGWTLEYLSP